jgi:hypothetical protein
MKIALKVPEFIFGFMIPGIPITFDNDKDNSNSHNNKSNRPGEGINVVRCHIAYENEKDY